MTTHNAPVPPLLSVEPNSPSRCRLPSPSPRQHVFAPHSPTRGGPGDTALARVWIYYLDECIDLDPNSPQGIPDELCSAWHRFCIDPRSHKLILFRVSKAVSVVAFSFFFFEV